MDKGYSWIPKGFSSEQLTLPAGGGWERIIFFLSQHRATLSMDAGLPLWQMVWPMPWRWAVNNKRLNGEVLQPSWRRRRGIPTTNTGGWGELGRWITCFVRLCWFDGTHRRWINRYMLCNSEESYSLQVLIVSWDVRGEDFWIPEVLKQYKQLLWVVVYVLVVYEYLQFLMYHWKWHGMVVPAMTAKNPCDLVISGGNTNIQEILRLIM